ncbi:glycosyltransferase [Anaerolineales bacterium HSG6]|nr:glycosyltransferase [Anaerolineales bacterium HSG6]MDM8531050.1 glycosyltransferase [Anaerolineales bacterium HSG25]
MKKQLIKISVVIPSLHSTFIDKTLTTIRNQNFNMDVVEVLVVGLDSPNLIEEDQIVSFISTGEPVSPAIARNIGIKRARGEFICFTDADCLPDKNWLKYLSTLIEETNYKIVGGSVVFDTDSYWTWCDNLSWFHEFLPHSEQSERGFLPSLNLMVHCSVIDKVGLFDESYPYPAGEDADWTIRMRMDGYKLYFEPSAKIKHCHNRTNLKTIWQHGFIYGKSSVKINPKYRTFLNTPFFLKQWWLLAILTPFITTGVVIRIWLKQPNWKQATLVVPGIFITKLAWCMGAISTLQQKNRNNGH